MTRRRKPAGRKVDLRPAEEQSPRAERKREVDSPGGKWRQKAAARGRADHEQWAEENLAEAELRDSLTGPVPPEVPLGRWRARWRKHATEGQILDQAVRLKAKLVAQRVPATTAELRAAEFASRARCKFMPNLPSWTKNTAQRLLRERQATSGRAERRAAYITKLFSKS